MRLHRLATVVATRLVSACGDVAVVSDTVHSRLSIDAGESSVSRIYTAGLVLFEETLTAVDPDGRPEVTPDFTLEVEAIQEGTAESDASVHRLVLELDGNVREAVIDRIDDGRLRARLRATVRCPRRWDGCMRDAHVSVERDEASTSSPAFGVTVRVSSRYRSGRLDDGYGEFAEIARVTVP